MDIIPTSTAPPTAATGGVKTPEAETETPSRVQPVKPLNFSNGVLKRHNPLHNHLNAPPPAVTYRECLKNHAAAMGGHAVDGCGEFMPCPDATPTDPTSLKCAACGCHRNFHRREPEEPHLPLPPTSAAQHVIEYQPHHRHHPPPPPLPRGGVSSPNSPSPPPISSSYYPSAPHMLLALSSGGISGHPPGNNPSIATPTIAGASSSGRKRFRTKFTPDQKERMYEFAEKVGWKVQKRDEDMISEFCSEVGVDRGVLKVWMHNNKNTLGKKDVNNSNGFRSRNSLDETTVHGEHHHHHHNHTNGNDNGSENPNLHPNHHYHNNDTVSAHVVATNGSSSSS